MTAIILTVQGEAKQLRGPFTLLPGDLFLNSAGEVCVSLEPVYERLAKHSGTRCAKVCKITGKQLTGSEFLLKVGEKYYQY